MPADDRPLHALNRVLESIEAVRNGQALYVLLAAFALAGLLLAMAQAALARGAPVWGVLEGGLALTVAFYGGNAAGLLLMDEARGRPSRGVGPAVRDALTTAHRLIVVLVAAGLAASAGVVLLLLLLWLCRLPAVGAWLFGLVVPLGVLGLGVLVLAMVGVVGPLAAPAVWDGLGVRATLAFLRRQLRQRLVFAALLHAAVGLLTAAVGALVSFAVISGGRAVAALAVLVTGIELPPQQLLAGAAVAQHPYGAAALVGGGLVFALALVLPAVVYLRGSCSVFLALREADARRLQAQPAG